MSTTNSASSASLSASLRLPRGETCVHLGDLVAHQQVHQFGGHQLFPPDQLQEPDRIQERLGEDTEDGQQVRPLPRRFGLRQHSPARLLHQRRGGPAHQRAEHQQPEPPAGHRRRSILLPEMHAGQLHLPEHPPIEGLPQGAAGIVLAAQIDRVTASGKSGWWTLSQAK